MKNIISLFFILFSSNLFSRDFPFEISMNINPEKYDSLIVVDISESEKRYYVKIMIGNSENEYYQYIHKQNNFDNKYLIMQVKSGQICYLNDIILTDGLSGLSDRAIIEVSKKSILKTEKGKIYWFGKLVLTKQPDGDVGYVYTREYIDFENALKKIRDKFTNKYWSGVANNMLLSKTF
jgi:hypothetical protein